MRPALTILSILTLPAFGEEPVPSFRNEVMPVLSRSGCNLGTCHGNQLGKGGLKLSLRGQYPNRDYATLTRALGARRVNVMEPDSSLLLQKPLAQVPHQGGKRFRQNSLAHSVLRNWIAAGMPVDRDTSPRLKKLSVTPNHQTIYAPNDSLNIKVTAEFSDGQTRDVTRRSVFEPSSLHVSVSAAGVARSERPGSSSITVRHSMVGQRR